MKLHAPSGPAAIKTTLSAATAALMLCGNVQAQAQAQALAPGLWENTTKMNVATADSGANDAMARMQKEMASMPPAQRKMMEDMLAKQGVGLGAAPNSVRVCISPEQAARGAIPQDRGGCTQESLQRTGNTLRMKFSCQGPPPSNGEGEYTFSGDKAYSGRMKMTTSPKGQAASVDMETTGRWISADCGALKPRP